VAARLLQVVVFPYRGCSFTAVTRVKIEEAANVASENEHAPNVRACHGFAWLAADANSCLMTKREPNSSRRSSCILR
jgi:hypothetical protein